MPFLRDLLERAFRRLAIRFDGQLLLDRRVFALSENGAGFVALLSRLDKADHRIDSEVHALLLYAVGVVPAPELPAAGLNEKVEAVAVRQFVSLIARRSEEHTSALQYLMRISYALICLTQKTHTS